MDQLSEEQRLIDVAEKHASEETSEYKFACTILNVAESAGLLPNGIIREQRQRQMKQFIGGVIERLYGLTPKEISLLDSDSQAAGDENAEIEDDFTKHLMRRHEELALHVKQECTKAIDLIEQYTRPDFYAWLLMDHAGQKSDPYKRATEAKTVLLGLINSNPSERPQVLTDAATAMRDKCVEKVKIALADQQRNWTGGVARVDYELGVRATYTHVLAILESLTLDQVKPEKTNV